MGLGREQLPVREVWKAWMGSAELYDYRADFIKKNYYGNKYSFSKSERFDLIFKIK